jgi:hypothetical protein
MPSAFESDPKEREVGSLIRHQPNLPRRKALVGTARICRGMATRQLAFRNNSPLTWSVFELRMRPGDVSTKGFSGGRVGGPAICREKHRAPSTQ